MAQENGTTPLVLAARRRDVATPPIPTRVQALQAQARSLAAEHVQDVVAEMKALEASAASIADGGEAYPAGVRDLCRRLAADLEGAAQTITALAGRKP